MSTIASKVWGRNITGMWIDDFIASRGPIFFLKKIGFRHYIITNEAGEPIHHIRGTRPEARGQFDAYVRKLEKVTDLFLK